MSGVAAVHQLPIKALDYPHYSPNLACEDAAGPWLLMAQVHYMTGMC